MSDKSSKLFVESCLTTKKQFIERKIVLRCTLNYQKTLRFCLKTSFLILLDLKWKQHVRRPMDFSLPFTIIYHNV